MNRPSPFDAPGQPNPDLRPIRWRIIPAALLTALGLVVIAGGGLIVVSSILMKLPPTQHRTILQLTGTLWIGVGSLAVGSGRMVWRGQWLTAVLLALIAWALGAVTTLAIQP
ncbi:MAG: hypothetical protein NXI04_23950 [Planctomycetaceae bacterium]|nr:hypothetical protein [Planctomycetaceae bacterium]